MVVDSRSRLAYYSSDPAFAVDQHLRVRAWNRGASLVLGYAESEVLGQPCYAALRAVTLDGRPLCTPSCPARCSFEGSEPYAAELCVGVAKDGQRIELSLGSMVIPRELQGEDAVAIVFLRPAKPSSVAATHRAPLRVFTMGPFAMYVGARAVPVHAWQRRQSLTLLKYLLTCHGEPVHRERLIESLWPEVPPQQGRERLKVVVYALRRALQTAGAGTDQVRRSGETYVLVRDGLWVDRDAFEELIESGDRLARLRKAEDALRRYEEADALYCGDYLAEDLYADWCAMERERLRETYLALLEKIAALRAAGGDYEKAVLACRKALAREPCRETMHRSLMTYLWRAGRRDEALAQFHTCADVLARELDVEPMPDTHDLYRQIAQSRQGGTLAP